MHNNQEGKTNTQKTKTKQSKSLVLAPLFLLNEQHT